ncbi:hypothetical protein C0Q70_04327 [Pomacea canaliculata]|uniref:Uncharacterized protein n=1 Tax=Pomacea canaliculata TaxID=400727 RepID=A0A2T7PV84_POMCA|nr:hypothetical protein C0Q70_04327 [Pomacea canaliculata]
MADRKAELERKKARLEKMRRERKEKELSKKEKGGEDFKESKTSGDSSIDPDELLRQFESTSASPVKSSPISQSSVDTIVTSTSISHTTPRKVRLSVAKVNETKYTSSGKCVIFQGDTDYHSRTC